MPDAPEASDSVSRPGEVRLGAQYLVCIFSKAFIWQNRRSNQFSCYFFLGFPYPSQVCTRMKCHLYFASGWTCTESIVLFSLIPRKLRYHEFILCLFVCLFVFGQVYQPLVLSKCSPPVLLRDDIPASLWNQVQTDNLLWPRRHKNKCHFKGHVKSQDVVTQCFSLTLESWSHMMTGSSSIGAPEWLRVTEPPANLFWTCSLSKN